MVDGRSGCEWEKKAERERVHKWKSGREKVKQLEEIRG